MADLLNPENGIAIYKGASKTLKLSVVDAAGKPVAINGALIIFTIKRDIKDPQPLLQKKSTDATQVLITAPDVGLAEIYLLPSDTQTWDVRVYTFDVWIQLASGARYVIVPPSDFKVERGVTTFL